MNAAQYLASRPLAQKQAADDLSGDELLALAHELRELAAQAAATAAYLESRGMGEGHARARLQGAIAEQTARRALAEQILTIG